MGTKDKLYFFDLSFKFSIIYVGIHEVLPIFTDT